MLCYLNINQTMDNFYKNRQGVICTWTPTCKTPFPY